MNTNGTITSFSPARGAYFDIGGDSYSTLTGLKSYSLTNPDPQTLRFEIRPGDSGWNDGGDNVDRSQVNQTPELINPGTPIAIDYQFMVQPNGPNNTFTNTASWFVTSEMQSGAGSSVGASPSFAVELAGNHLQIVARYVQPGGNPANGSPDLHMLTLWTDPNPIQPGQYKDINIQANNSNSGGGYLKVSVDGNQVVNYEGPLGYGDPTYWMEGLYRNAGPTQTVIADFRNLTMVTGSQAAGWAGVGGPTSSGSTTQPSAPTTPMSPTTPTSPITSPTTPPRTSTTPTTPIAPTTPTTPTTPGSSETTPVLTVANPALSVRGRGGSVDLGVNVSTTDRNDRVTVNITGLPKYETITSNLDGRTYRGNNITLTAAQVDAGLVLNSYYRNGGSPGATLTLTANAKDPVTGATASAAPQTIAVANSRYAASTTSSQPTAATSPLAATDTTTTSPVVNRAMSSVNTDQASKAVATAAPALLSQLRDMGGVATLVSQTITATNDAQSSGTTTAGLANQSYALLNQHLAGCTGRFDAGQIVASASNGATAGQVSFLTRPQH